MRQFPDRDGPDLDGDEAFGHPAFAALKRGGAAFAIVDLAQGDVVWANEAAAAFFDADDRDALATALFGPDRRGGGWLEGLARGVVPGRPPRLARGGLSRGFRMRAHTALLQAVETAGGERLAFAVPETSRSEASPDAWRRTAWTPEPSPDERDAPSAPSPVAAAPAEEAAVEAPADPGTSLARRSQIAVLRDRLSAALDGAATLRLLWRTDVADRVTRIDTASLARLGVRVAALDGGVLPEVVAGFDPGGGERLRAAMASRSTWSGLTLDLPVADGAARVPMVLSGSPVLGSGRAFDGFRGFGTIDLGRLALAPERPAESAPLRSAEHRPAQQVPAEPRPAEPTSAEPTLAEPLSAPTTGPVQETAAPPRDEAHPEREDAAPAPTPANVVHLRAFQALASGRVGGLFGEPAFSAAAPTAPQRPPVTGDAATGDTAAPAADAALSDDLAFQALGEALRARIGGLRRTSDRPNDEAPPADVAQAAPPPQDHSRTDLSRDDTSHEAPAQPVEVTRDLSSLDPSPEQPLRDEPLRESTTVAEATPEQDAVIAPPAAVAPQDAAAAAAPVVSDAPPAAVARTSRDTPAAASALLRDLPLPLIVTVGAAPVFANTAAERLLGDPAAADLAPLVDGRLAAIGAGSVTLRDARHRDLSVDALQAAVTWNGDAAVLWVLAEAAEPAGAVAESRPSEPRLVAAGDEAEVGAGELLDRVDDAVALLDGSGLVRRLNRRGEIWFEGAQGRSFTQLLAPESRPAALALLGEVRMQRDGLAAPPRRQDVEARPAGAGATPMVLTLGRLGSSGFYLTLRDVTALRRAETERAGAERDPSRDADRLPALLGKVSHEIRTPLNAILGFAEVMMDERFGPLGNQRYKDYLRDIHTSGTQVMTLVEDLLDLSRIEAGQLDLSVAALDVNRIVAETVAQMQPEAHRERVIMRTSLGGRIPAVLADERSARQIVRNLLSNAVKFNEPGGQVIVSTALSDSGRVLLRVRDTGVGMTDDEIATALEPFGGVSPDPANGNAAGNGLGLPLTRALVGVNGASMAISSRPREGTLVEVAFAAAAAADERRPA